MAIVVIDNLTREDIQRAREEYLEYIKVTADIVESIVAIGGEYHADAEEILIRNFGGKSKNIWGGGYNIKLHKFETNAVLNIKPQINDSSEIIDPEIRKFFLSLVKQKLINIEEFL